jgi:hypothetical protein
MLTPVEKDVGEEPNTEPSSKLQKLEQEEAGNQLCVHATSLVRLDYASI